MPTDYDATEFVDSDFEAAQKTSHSASSTSAHTQRAPSREEVDSRVSDAQQKLSELRRAQEELERERASLEETRRRQTEFQNGRQEMIHNLTRGLGLLEEAEFTARRDAEQMAKALADFRDALSKIEAVREETWTADNFSVELTRALTAIENARMEWNSARLKFSVLNGEAAQATTQTASGKKFEQSLFPNRGFAELCKLGLALTWPLAVVAVLAFAVLLAVLLRH